MIGIQSWLINSFRIFFLSFLIIAPVCFAHAESGVFDPETIDVVPGSTFSIDIDASDLIIASTIETIMEYDPDLLEFISATADDTSIMYPLFSLGLIFATSTEGLNESASVSVVTATSTNGSGKVFSAIFKLSETADSGAEIDLKRMTVYKADLSSVEAATSSILTINSAVPDSNFPILSNSFPSGTLAYDTSTTTMSVVTNINAVCHFATSSGVSYDEQLPFTVTGNTTHTTSLVNLVPDTSYFYYLKCRDTLSNTNDTDYLIAFRVALDPNFPPADTSAPTRSNGSPVGALSNTTNAVTLSVNTNETAICHYSTTINVPYANSSAFTNTNATTHTTLISGLSAGNSYNYYIRCTDSYNNINTDDYTIAFSINSATVSSGGSSGGSGGVTPTPIVSTPLVNISNLKISSSSDSIKLEWTNPVRSDFFRVLIIRLNSLLTNYDSSSVVLAKKLMSYESKSNSYLDTGVLDYYNYYVIYSVYNDGKMSAPLVTNTIYNELAKNVIIPSPVTINLPVEIPIVTPVEISLPKSLNGASSAIVEQVSKKEAAIIMLRFERVALDAQTLLIYEKVIKNKNVTDNYIKYRVAHFIHFGTDTTKQLGAGERGGVLNSYYSAFSKMPSLESDWMDVIKIANGRWPTARNVNLENKNKSETFKKIYKREADMNDAKDNAAVSVITYGLRPLNRKVENEKIAIKHFKGIFKYNPVSAGDWDIVRAIAYSGAIR